jgi:membrane protein required for colicin V production
MNALDWVFIVVLALLGLRCMIKGFVAEVLSVAAILAGLLGGLFLYKGAGQLFVVWGLKAKPEILPAILGFAAVFILIFLVVKIIERLLREGIEAAELGGVDRALGLVLGLAEGLLVVSIVLVAMSLLEPSLKTIAGYSKLLSGSFFARLILPVIGPEVAKATQGMKLDAPRLQLKAPDVKKP